MTTPDSAPDARPASAPPDSAPPHSAPPDSAQVDSAVTSERRLPLTWAITLAFGVASFTGILALTSDLAKTDAVLTEGVGQVVQIDRTTTSGVVGNLALPPIDAAVRDSTPSVIGTADSLRRANAALATLSAQVRTLADVLTGAQGPLVHTITTAEHTDRTVGRLDDPARHIVDTLRTVDHRTAGLGPALDRTLRLSRSIEGKLHILRHLPGH
jgi:hypothetical protein